MKIIGFDKGSPNGDWTVETEVRHLPDGTFIIENIHRYRTTIELKAETSALTSAQQEEK